MKLFAKLSALSVAVILTTAASATTYTIGSYGGNAAGSYANTPIQFDHYQGAATPGPGNGIPTAPTGVIGIANGLWHAPIGASSWVSYGQTGPTTPPGSQPGGNYAPNGNYFFTTNITLDNAANAFNFSVLADDTVTVFIDGTAVPGLTAASGGNSTCQDNVPNCLTVTTFNSGSTGYLATLALLTAGQHTLTFEVMQLASIDMGLDFEGTISTNLPGTVTPEPSTLMLFGTGLVGSAGALMRRMKAARLK
jgi:hypothetical protein